MTKERSLAHAYRMLYISFTFMTDINLTDMILTVPVSGNVNFKFLFT